MDGAGVTEWLGHAARRLQEEAQCAGAEGGNGTAVNPNVFENEVGQLVGTSLLCFVVTCLAVAAGIGGGGLLVPLYAFVLGLGPKNAVPVSKATIFGVAIGNVFFIGRERHPKANRPLIDYSTAVFMQGGELAVRASVQGGGLRPRLVQKQPQVQAQLAVVASPPRRQRGGRKRVDKEGPVPCRAGQFAWSCPHSVAYSFVH